MGSRTMSLRGSLPMTIGRAVSFGVASEHQIFEYESPDRTKGWRVTYARMWLQQCVTGTAGGDGRLLAQFTLSTDSLGAFAIVDADDAKEWENRMGAGDNRTIAWSTTDYQQRDNVDGDFIVPAAGQGNHDMLLDVDRIVTSELWVQLYGITEFTNFDTTCNYYVELEEVKVTPAQSVFQQLKGIGQDIDS